MPRFLMFVCVVLLAVISYHIVNTNAVTQPESGLYKRIVLDPDSTVPQPASWGKKTSLFASQRSSVAENTQHIRPESDFPLLARKIKYLDRGKECLPTDCGIKIMPRQLDFMQKPVCMAATETIELINLSDKEMVLFSVHTDSDHFHFIGFSQKIIPPGANSTLSFVFLPRELGLVEDIVDIRTSSGTYVYQLAGQGVPNPYRVTPLTGVRVPVNTRYSPPIWVYNPSPHKLNITEVYTHGGFLHLSMPSGTNDERQSTISEAIWEIPPFSSKEIVNVEFSAENPGKFQGFVVVKTSEDVTMMFPIEVLVVKGGTHAVPEIVNFGTIATLHERKKMELSLLNSCEFYVQVTDVRLITSDSSVSVNFSQVTLHPNSERVVATVTYTAKAKGLFKGKILLRTNDSNPINSRIEIPYKAHVIPGTLEYASGTTTFGVARPSGNRCNSADWECINQRIREFEMGSKLISDFDSTEFVEQKKDMVVTNKFRVPISIAYASIDDRHFSIVGFVPTTLGPDETKTILQIRYLPDCLGAIYAVPLELITNVSTVSIPLQVFHGLLGYTVPEQPDQGKTGVNFGVLRVSSIRTRTVNITNSNSVKIPVYSITSNTTALTLSVDSFWNAQGYATSGIALEWNVPPTGVLLRTVKREFGEPIFTLEPGSSVLLTIKLAPQVQEDHYGCLQILTLQEVLTIPITYQSLHGAVEFYPQTLQINASVLEPTTVVIAAKSTATHPIRLLSISSSDPRVVAVLNTVLVTATELPVATVTVDISREVDKEFTYTALGMSQPSEPLNAVDLDVVEHRRAAWKRHENSGASDIKAILTINTDINIYTLHVHATFRQTAIVSSNSLLDFGLTQLHVPIGKTFPITNPSDQPIHVQLLPSSNSTEINSSFYLTPDAIAGMVVPPHSVAALGPMFFSPSIIGKMATTFFLKNNLTIVETITVQGEGGAGNIDLVATNGSETDPTNHVVPIGGSADDKVILFKLTADTLNNCTRSAKTETPDELPPLTLERRFFLFNGGNMAVRVHKIAIDGRNCTGYGFTVSPCQVLRLEPSEYQNLTITFTPDFSATIVRHDLVIETADRIRTLPIIVTIPTELLIACVDAYALEHLPLEFQISGRTIGGISVIGLSFLVILGLLYALITSSTMVDFGSHVTQNQHGASVQLYPCECGLGIHDMPCTNHLAKDKESTETPIDAPDLPSQSNPDPTQEKTCNNSTTNFTKTVPNKNLTKNLATPTVTTGPNVTSASGVPLPQQSNSNMPTSIGTVSTQHNVNTKSNYFEKSLENNAKPGIMPTSSNQNSAAPKTNLVKNKSKTSSKVPTLDPNPNGTVNTTNSAKSNTHTTAKNGTISAKSAPNHCATPSTTLDNHGKGKVITPKILPNPTTNENDKRKFATSTSALPISETKQKRNGRQSLDIPATRTPGYWENLLPQTQGKTGGDKHDQKPASPVVKQTSNAGQASYQIPATSKGTIRKEPSVKPIDGPSPIGPHRANSQKRVNQVYLPKQQHRSSPVSERPHSPTHRPPSPKDVGSDSLNSTQSVSAPIQHSMSKRSTRQLEPQSGSSSSIETIPEVKLRRNSNPNTKLNTHNTEKYPVDLQMVMGPRYAPQQPLLQPTPSPTINSRHNSDTENIESVRSISPTLASRVPFQPGNNSFSEIWHGSHTERPGVQIQSRHAEQPLPFGEISSTHSLFYNTFPTPFPLPVIRPGSDGSGSSGSIDSSINTGNMLHTPHHDAIQRSFPTSDSTSKTALLSSVPPSQSFSSSFFANPFFSSSTMGTATMVTPAVSTERKPPAVNVGPSPSRVDVSGGYTLFDTSSSLFSGAHPFSSSPDFYAQPQTQNQQGPRQ